MSYTVYWNNICLLSNMEENFIKSNISKQNDYEYKFKYYGLGRNQSMKDKIIDDLRKGDIKGDIIVSTDLDIFQDTSICKNFYELFRNDISLLPSREELLNSTIHHPTGYFYPFIVIPLVIVVNTRALNDTKMPLSLKDLLDPAFSKKYAFGGMHNSAGKSLFRGIWYLYGQQAAEEFLSNAIVTSMPAQAFQKVRSGEVMAAVVPTIFAKRAGIDNLVSIWPKEGAIAIPSYVAVKKTVPLKVFNDFKNIILGQEHQKLLRDQGDIIPSYPDLHLPQSAKVNNCRLLYPKWDFFKQVF
ncbi:UNVERIFIED_CONTAM: extracellular solute-binding protein [Acetivibrio alkalicellulosi]